MIWLINKSLSQENRDLEYERLKIHMRPQAAHDLCSLFHREPAQNGRGVGSKAVLVPQEPL